MADDTPVTRSKHYAPAMQRVADAYAMRIRGAGWEEIARALGYANPQNAMRAVRNYIGKLPEPQLPELRSMWRERLEYLWPLATRDVEAQRPGAVRAAVAIADRAAKLDGLDAPTRVEIESDRLDEIVASLLARAGHELAEDADVLELDVLPEDDEGGSQNFA